MKQTGMPAELPVDSDGEIITTHLQGCENTFSKLAVFGLLHLSKCGLIALGSDLKLVKQFSGAANITIKQRDEIFRIVKFQETRFGGPDEFCRYIRKMTG